MVFFGDQNFSVDFVAKSSVEGEVICCICSVPTSHKASKLRCEPDGIARVVGGSFKREEMVVGVGNGSMIVVPDHLDVVQTLQLVPLLMGNPIPKCTYAGVFEGTGGPGESEWCGGQGGAGGSEYGGVEGST